MRSAVVYCCAQGLEVCLTPWADSTTPAHHTTPGSPTSSCMQLLHRTPRHMQAFLLLRASSCTVSGVASAQVEHPAGFPMLLEIPMHVGFVPYSCCLSFVTKSEHYSWSHGTAVHSRSCIQPVPGSLLLPELLSSLAFGATTRPTANVQGWYMLIVHPLFIHEYGSRPGEWAVPHKQTQLASHPVCTNDGLAGKA
jgi:hypothetical protein